ncbi:MAG: hypothetical protein HC836_41095 [Richelia sp. RM2_1_2]|nr:hypothetical protein [Richelia sp. RM2_1_2]
MFKKLCGQAFETVNVIVGVSSLAAIAIGALTVFGNASLLGLDQIGVKTVAEKQIKQSIQIGMYCILTGGIGFFSAITVAVGIGTILSADDEDNSESKTSCHDSVVSSSTDSLYLYQIMRITITGCHHQNKLIVARIEDEASRKTVIYDWLDARFQDDLVELFDLDCNEDNLIGKAFSSSQTNPKNAIREFLDFYRPQLEFKSSCEEFSFNLETCVGCRNFYGANNIVCAIHPYGWEQDENCPDWEFNKRNRRVYFPFERQGVIDQLNRSIEQNQAHLIKNDDGTLTLWDDYTNRRFHFSWSGILLDGSDKLVEIGKPDQLLDYIQYLANRNVIEVDYSSKIDEFTQQLRDVATVEISDDGINIKVNYCSKLNINIERKYRFRFDGIPLYPYESIVPQVLKHNYNLATFVEWLRANKLRINR